MSSTSLPPPTKKRRTVHTTGSTPVANTNIQTRRTRTASCSTSTFAHPDPPISNVRLRFNAESQQTKIAYKLSMDRWTDALHHELAAEYGVTNHSNNHTNNHTLELERLKQQMATLKSENKHLRDELMDHSAKREKVERAYNDSLIQRDFFQMRLKSLACMFKAGQPPRFDDVAMHKSDQTMTQQIYQIKQSIAAHVQRQQMPQPAVPGPCQLQHRHVEINHFERHKMWIKQQSLAQSIANHLQVNKAHESKPMLVVAKHKSKNKNKYKMNIGNFNELKHDFRLLSYKQMLEIFRIGPDHRIPALRAGFEHGLRAKQVIPKCTVIGQFVGVEYTADEWARVFSHSNEESLRNVYAFDQTIKVPAAEDRVKLIIDGCGLKHIISDNRRNQGRSPYSVHLLYVNDCREDISNDLPTPTDEPFWNVDFVSADVDGYPMVFVVSRRDIACTEELMAFYGSEYEIALSQQTQWQRMQNRAIDLLDQSVLKGVDMSREIWTIE